jgi:large subunit ribosomal protein L18Ae
MHQYQIVGRAAPTQKNPVPKIYRIKIFARDAVQARSRFWYFMKRLNRAKKSGGEILAMNELFDRSPAKVKNFGVMLRYTSRTDTHNMYKEYRDTTVNGAVSQMYAEMAGSHRADANAIQILKTVELKAAECRRPHVLQMHKGTKFPVVRKMPLTQKKFKTLFKASRPTTFLN